MLTENDVIDILCNHLKTQGYQIIKASNTSEKGVDIIAENAEYRLCIEAKGETSSKQHTARYGVAFNGSQIKSHVSRALLSALLVLNEEHNAKKLIAGIALPDNLGHRSLINKILKSLTTLGIRIFWVSETGIEEQY